MAFARFNFRGAASLTVVRGENSCRENNTKKQAFFAVSHDGGYTQNRRMRRPLWTKPYKMALDMLSYDKGK